ncbi:cob(I)alamin adenosyltransferase/cobinamide ATP-dependent adenosyltransferase [Vallitalea longa]|uniref:Cob(I)alamin adenosyltransferase/cobinamide ATP-dependent adenosyltransferase n=1 Tax=Vallitalea longa TaxID=2936439 RepID=A0A9W6DHB4_9FIRM|nr:cob(I)yrinic acid a,c-diamide adenosyltransferase [Vallitalea longa]GKX31278.1 cob(I)alamin adenosyltransferase/cobinamide ATP-dependent adenosyltransferase [Vallitalea longa]
MSNNQKGVVLCYTGNGKGKSTAAFGLAIRSIGHGKKVCIIQFIKSADILIGEREVFKKLDVEMYSMGKGFTNINDIEDHKKGITEAWELTKDKINSGEYDLIVLDEINNVFAIDRFPIEDVLSVEDCIDVFKNRPDRTNIVITGRNAPEKLMDAVDLVTICEEKKHYYNEGRMAVKGIEY